MVKDLGSTPGDRRSQSKWWSTQLYSHPNGPDWEIQNLPLPVSDSRLLLEKAPNSSGLLEMDSTSPAAAPRTEAHLTQSGTKRLRTRQACRPCHLLKAKCSGSLPACQRCSQKGIPCEYASSKPSSGTRKRRRAIASSGTQQNHPLLSPLISPKETASAGYSLQALPSQRTRIHTENPIAMG